MRLVCSNHLELFIHCFFRRICFPKLNFSELRTPYHTFTSLLSENGKRKRGWGWRDSLSGLVPVKSDLPGDLFFFWRQIRCSNQAVFEGERECPWDS